LIGLLFGLSFGFNLDSHRYTLGDWLHDGFLFGAGIGLGSLLLQSLFALEPRRGMPTTRQQRWPVRFWQTALVMRALLVAVIYGLGRGQDPIPLQPHLLGPEWK
jgi:hypothetical protein